MSSSTIRTLGKLYTNWKCVVKDYSKKFSKDVQHKDTINKLKRLIQNVNSNHNTIVLHLNGTFEVGGWRYMGKQKNGNQVRILKYFYTCLIRNDFIIILLIYFYLLNYFEV